MNDDSLTEEELQSLKDSKTEDEWSALCQAVKKARGGQYPLDWFAKVIQSGLSSQKSQSFGYESPIRISHPSQPK
jgi:hypothetical protein